MCAFERGDVENTAKEGKQGKLSGARLCAKKANIASKCLEVETQMSYFCAFYFSFLCDFVMSKTT